MAAITKILICVWDFISETHKQLHFYFFVFGVYFLEKVIRNKPLKLDGLSYSAEMVSSKGN